MSDQSDHDLLLEIRGDVKHLVTQGEDQETRIRNLENQQFRWLGRDGAIMAGLSAVVAFVVALCGGGGH